MGPCDRENDVVIRCLYRGASQFWMPRIWLKDGRRYLPLCHLMLLWAQNISIAGFPADKCMPLTSVSDRRGWLVQIECLERIFLAKPKLQGKRGRTQCTSMKVRSLAIWYGLRCLCSSNYLCFRGRKDRENQQTIGLAADYTFSAGHRWNQGDFSGTPNNGTPLW